MRDSEAIPDISFDLARIREEAGLGYVDDLLDSAFAAFKITPLRSIEQTKPRLLGFRQSIIRGGNSRVSRPCLLASSTSASKLPSSRRPNFSSKRPPGGARLQRPA
jgi:hypothetical protein